MEPFSGFSELYLMDTSLSSNTQKKIDFQVNWTRRTSI